MNRKQPVKRKRGRPATGKAVSAAQRMRRSRAKRKAAGFRVQTRWVAATSNAPPFSTHRLLEARSLALHALIARKIERDPALLEIPRRNLDRWRARSPESPSPWIAEWQAMLKRPWPQVAACMTEPSEEGARLRQSTPFAGVLNEEERARIYEAFGA